MITIKILPQFVLREKDAEYLDSLPPNIPGACYTKEQKKHIDAIYTRYITKNNVMKGSVIEIYLSERKRGWPNGEKMTVEAAQRSVLINLIELLKEPAVTIERLAQLYRQGIMLDEAQRILLFFVYDFQ